MPHPLCGKGCGVGRVGVWGGSGGALVGRGWAAAEACWFRMGLVCVHVFRGARRLFARYGGSVPNDERGKGFPRVRVREGILAPAVRTADTLRLRSGQAGLGRCVWTVGGSAVQSSRWDSGCVWRSGFPGLRPGLSSGRAYGTQARLTGFPGLRAGLRSGRAYGTQERIRTGSRRRRGRCSAGGW